MGKVIKICSKWFCYLGLSIYLGFVKMIISMLIKTITGLNEKGNAGRYEVSYIEIVL